MCKKLLALLLIALPAVGMAEKAFIQDDTIYVNDKRKEVAQPDATMFGIVKDVNRERNIATIHYYQLADSRLVSVEHRVAEGKDYGRKNGPQLYYEEDGTVGSMELYTLVPNEKNDKMQSRLMQEKLLYPDGKTREEVQFDYSAKGKGPQKPYDRKCFYPDGTTLQYRETFSAQQLTTTYYDESGKLTDSPAERFPLYETLPGFPGGTKAIFEYLSNEVKYPPIALKNRIQGKVIVEFVVNKDGSISDVTVKKSGGDPSLDWEAVRVVGSMPNWFPGTKRGKPVRTKYAMPVNFRLE